MWVKEFTGRSDAAPERVFEVLADIERWSDWNEGVSDVRVHGAFVAGTTAEMVFPDGSALPFRLTWVESPAGYEDLTEMPEEGISVRVRHALAPVSDGVGTLITYRCEVDGPEESVAAVGEAVTEDFDAVIAALATRAEARVG